MFQPLSRNVLVCQLFHTAVQREQTSCTPRESPQACLWIDNYAEVSAQESILEEPSGDCFPDSSYDSQNIRISARIQWTDLMTVSLKKRPDWPLTVTMTALLLSTTLSKSYKNVALNIPWHCHNRTLIFNPYFLEALDLDMYPSGRYARMLLGSE